MGEAAGEPPRRMAAIFVIALVFWFTEAVALFATSLLVIAGGLWMLSAMPGAAEPLPTQTFFGALSNPIVFVFLGGFILAQAVQKEGIDRQLAALLLRPFGTHPYAILAGLMIVTAVFSMWMSNTATTAMMVVLLAPILEKAGGERRLRKALTLAIPFGANIGGLGTPIGTPPNAIAMAQLKECGHEISFLGWMVVAVPLLLGGLVLAWALLIVLFRPPTARLPGLPASPFRFSRNAIIVYTTFIATVMLWVFGTGIGVPTSVASIVPVAVLTATGVISREDFNRLDWATLVLIAGGIALGNGVGATGLDAYVMGLIPTSVQSLWMLSVMGCIAAAIMSTVMSNTVACNILLPIIIAIGASFVGNFEMQVLVIMLATGANFGMALPISTPPNVIAYSTGEVSSADMLWVGGAISVMLTIFVCLTGPPIISLLLRL